MSAIPNRKMSKSTNYKNHFIVAGILAGVGIALLAYLMFYVSPAEVLETVKIIAVTDSGCIAETLDGHAVNIGQCQGEPGDFVSAYVDQKLKERAALMNPTN
ncbi:hypothetical protein AAA799E16_00867 [Marine Group I thaumarchaeote SCGC AAA799-E16]|uniref:Uncharacterized protein n=4 Tax=Marine Group I TaxID=905826 RepID=A0A081RM19_9ARCH|nr:hypothetical protein AAA799N04_01327 [Marine Group I thaumarchaeote SCGC AAA799-N04]KER06355.1 hypothetical protein AAA799E16_00867 [Marine Group I thaumarchaeote SCGC AAA799-E16]KFM17231.1 hypothetical protein AAA799D11_00290 [Marine Group I thaumarchaeote SCGC AAA799-D11]KFM19088.1 hypothetical protein SCCGRSA3_00663 [Marine Group I thaumarchaeote SCGC RSA3]